MANWFSKYQGDDWTPKRKYNEYFGQMLVKLRQWFNLVKSNPPGVSIHDPAVPRWLEYTGVRGYDIYVGVEEMDIRGYKQYPGYITPHLRFKVRMARKVYDGRRGLLEAFFNPNTKNRGQARLEVFFSETLIMEFKGDPRVVPPLFIIDNPRFQFGTSHMYHQLNGGWLCIISGYNDWTGRDNLLTAIGAAFDWIVWYHKRHVWREGD